MSQNKEHKFEELFQTAVKASLQTACASDSLRARLIGQLATASTRAPSGLQEPELERFETALSHAIAGSQEWAPDEAIVLRVEESLSRELGCDLISERSAFASLDKPDAAKGMEGKARFVSALRASIQSSQLVILAPPVCRTRIEAALAAARSDQPSPRGAKVIAFPGRSRWKAGVAAVASLAAGVFLVFGTLLGGAEKALAESVRLDHERCCSDLQGSNVKPCTSVEDAGFGPLPEADVADGWKLVASKVCHSEEAQPMVHNLYVHDGKTMSLHFLPPQEKEPSVDLGSAGRESSQPRQIANDEFPVMAWEDAGWTVTACSTDLDASTLASAVAP